ncbi:unnamed protein product [Ascophyllum nodosum]
MVHRHSSFRMAWGHRQRWPRGGTVFTGKQPQRIDTERAGATQCSSGTLAQLQQARGEKKHLG